MTTVVPEPQIKPELDEETRKVLRVAKEIITQGWYALMPYPSDHQYRCRMGDNPACLEDSLHRQGATLGVAKAGNVLKALAGTNRLAAWNDAPGRTQEEVIALIDKALVD